MKIGLQTWGSEGDIRPFTALAAGLVRAGHEVELVATEVAERDYSAVATKHGFRLRMVASPVLKSTADFVKLGSVLLLARHPALQARLLLSRALAPVMPEITRAAFDLAAGCDLVVGHFILHPLKAAADVNGIPYVSLQLVHGLVPTRYHSPLGFPDLGKWTYPSAWWLARLAVNDLAKRDINALRAEHHLPVIKDVMLESWASSQLNLITVSPAIFNKPEDFSPHHVVCGFLDFPEDGLLESIPQELDRFLHAGAPPVYFGFGSLIPTEPFLLRQTVNIWKKAASRAGCRAVIQLPESLMAPFSNLKNCHFVGRVPHRILFPKCSLIVHHGGSGTTQAALLSGRPSVVIAHAADQFLWGQELVRLGAASASLSRLLLRSGSLARAIRIARQNPKFTAAATRIGEAMRQDTGVDTAVRSIQNLMQ